MPIPTPNPESSTTQPDSNQSMPDQQGISLVGGNSPLEQEIISDGNLVLIIGAGEKRLRITVQAARVASSVLSDMLDGNNITGADTTGRVFELRLPDDDATAARNAFGSIYPGNPHTDDLSPGEIYDVVIFARKYKMIPEFRKIASNWFRPRYCGRHFHPAHRFFGLEDCWYLVMAAYYMVLPGLPDFRFEFSKLSERLVRDERAYYNCRLHVRVPHAHDIEADIYWSIRDARGDYAEVMAQHSQCRCMGSSGPYTPTIFEWDYGRFYLCRGLA